MSLSEFFTNNFTKAQAASFGAFIIMLTVVLAGVAGYAGVVSVLTGAGVFMLVHFFGLAVGLAIGFAISAIVGLGIGFTFALSVGVAVCIATTTSNTGIFIIAYFVVLFGVLSVGIWFAGVHGLYAAEEN